MNRRMFFGAIGGGVFGAATPKRADMIIHNATQEGFEMPAAGYVDWITPIDRFFIRSHHNTPKVELAQWRLAVGGQVATALSLTMDDLRKLPSVELVAMCECAGNGRSFYEPSMPGIQWTVGGAGNGKWRGVRLADVLKKAGVKPEAKHVLFDGADVPVGTQPEFQRTVPIAKAMRPETLLAYEMNGETLPVSHGFPLRLVVPGWASDSWVKWITRVEVLDKEFDGFFMKTAYRHPGKGVAPGSAVKPEEMHPVEELQIKSLIASVSPKLVGAAWSGETPVARVEWSADRGRTWKPARITSPKTPFGMVTWEADWNAPQGYWTLMARAHDAKGRTQPLSQEWNPLGYQWNVAPAQSGDVGALATAAGRVAEPSTYKASCHSCHGEEPMMRQRLSRAQWDAEIAKMQRWGAPVRADQREAFIDYLFDRYPYRKK